MMALGGQACRGGLELLRKSLELDWRLLCSDGQSLGWRWAFVGKKYGALARVRSGTAKLELAPLAVTVRDLSGLGTLHSSIVDFHADVVSARILRDSPLILDIGANIGQFANAAKLYYPNARIISFEPDPEMFAELEVNTRNLRGIELHNVGLGDRRDVLTFYRHKLSCMSSFSTQADQVGERRGALELPIFPLDEMVDQGLMPDLVKIDVEGFERQVVRGGWGTLARSRFLLIEISIGRANGRDNMRLLREIAERIPAASILKFGRPLGEASRPACQDVLLSLRDDGCSYLPFCERF